MSGGRGRLAGGARDDVVAEPAAVRSVLAQPDTPAGVARQLAMALRAVEESDNLPASTRHTLRTAIQAVPPQDPPGRERP